jgi:hypothetical protein
MAAHLDLWLNYWVSEQDRGQSSTMPAARQARISSGSSAFANGRCRSSRDQ